MKIGIISDTHGRFDAWKKAQEIFAGADMIVHAGDVLYHPPRLGCGDGYDIPAMVKAMNESPVPIVIAQGNCDAQVYEELLEMPVQSPFAFVEFDRLRIVAHHGHIYGPEQMVALGEKYRADVFVTGHTHVPVLERIGNLIILNPGSPALPKYERDGQKIGSVAVITDGDIRIVSVENGETLFQLAR